MKSEVDIFALRCSFIKSTIMILNVVTLCRHNYFYKSISSSMVTSDYVEHT